MVGETDNARVDAPLGPTTSMRGGRAEDSDAASGIEFPSFAEEYTLVASLNSTLALSETFNP